MLCSVTKKKKKKKMNIKKKVGEVILPDFET